MSAAGRITRLFGAEGEVSLNLYTNFPTDFDWQEQPVFVRVDELVVPLFFESFTRRGVSGAVARFADIDTPNRAEIILDKEFSIAESEEDEEEFDLADLIGFSVKIGRTTGELTDFFDNPANPLFEIAIAGKTHLIPANEDFIAGIDFDKRTIRFVLPDGLLDL
ncbi:MAG: ribosome maturation factor RimM [Alistipes sp.]